MDCDACFGTGRHAHFPARCCSICGGTGQLSIACPRCGAVSYNATDVTEGYCSRCHDWTTIETILVDA